MPNKNSALVNYQSELDIKHRSFLVMTCSSFGNTYLLKESEVVMQSSSTRSHPVTLENVTLDRIAIRQLRAAVHYQVRENIGD